MRWFDVGRQGILVQIFPKYVCTSLPICSRSQLISHRYLFFYGPDPNAPQNQMISLSTSEFHCVFKKMVFKNILCTDKKGCSIDLFTSYYSHKLCGKNMYKTFYT